MLIKSTVTFEKIKFDHIILNLLIKLLEKKDLVLSLDLRAITIFYVILLTNLKKYPPYFLTFKLIILNLLIKLFKKTVIATTLKPQVLRSKN